MKNFGYLTVDLFLVQTQASVAELVKASFMEMRSQDKSNYFFIFQLRHFNDKKDIFDKK